MIPKSVDPLSECLDPAVGGSPAVHETLGAHQPSNLEAQPRNLEAQPQNLEAQPQKLEPQHQTFEPQPQPSNPISSVLRSESTAPAYAQPTQQPIA